jgi:uncharacterized protein (TIGR02001 family)
MLARTLFAALVALYPIAASAQQAPEPAPTPAPAPAFTLFGEVGLVSDYRFRGISLTSRSPALQASATLLHKSGFYGNVWASNLTDTPLYGELELDFTGGWTRKVSDNGTVDIGFGYFTYPDGHLRDGNANFGEAFARYSHSVGPVTGTLGLGYSPKQASLGDQDSFYVSGDLRTTVPHTPVTLNAHLGHTDGALAPNGRYLDWSLGATVALGKAQFGVTYLDTDIPGAVTANARSGVVGTAKITF